MHVLSINFISFAAQIYNALHMQGKKGDFGILGHGLFSPLNPPIPKSAYVCARRIHSARMVLKLDDAL